MQAIQQLVSEIVDYAGLFPPAGLSMRDVVENYAKYRSGPFSWILARLIVPTGRLNEFVEAASLPTTEQDRPWLVSALAPPVDADDDGFARAMQAIDEFNQRHRQPENGLAVIDTVEIKAESVQQVEKTASRVPAHIKTFLELPHENDPQVLIDAIRRCRPNVFAKIRTGGVKQELIPPPDQVARFIYQCGQSKIGFKATAGLHHPIRGDYRLAYDENADIGRMYGFLNVFIAACFAFEGIGDPPLIEQILTETSIGAFEFQSDCLSWQGQRVGVEAIDRIRRDYAISFGSCSFDEPTSELQQLGLLADLTIS